MIPVKYWPKIIYFNIDFLMNIYTPYFSTADNQESGSLEGVLCDDVTKLKWITEMNYPMFCKANVKECKCSWNLKKLDVGENSQFQCNDSRPSNWNNRPRLCFFVCHLPYHTDRFFSFPWCDSICVNFKVPKQPHYVLWDSHDGNKTMLSI